MIQDPFLLPIDEYKRDLNPIGDYIEGAAFYLSKIENRDLDECREDVVKLISPTGSRPLFNRKIQYLKYNAEGDREVAVEGLCDYLRDTVKDRDLLTPTLTRFVHPSIKQSFLAEYVKDNIKKRDEYKSVMFKANREGDKLKAAIFDKRQGGRKIANNSISGSYTVPSTPLVSPTFHAVLTSTCRNTSGYANANNEKMIAGNRHYFNEDVVINNITSIVTHFDKELLSSVMQKYQLTYPSTSDVMECIRRGAYKYFRSEYSYSRIEEYVNTLTQLEKAAFTYIGDLYHIRKFNDSFMRQFITEFTETPYTTVDEPEKIMKSANSIYYITAVMLMEKDAIGKDIKGLAKDDKDYIKAACIIKNVLEVVERYSDFIRVFFTTTNVPAQLSYFPDSLRHVAITSDTDSTIFTTQEWVLWYTDKIDSDKASNIAAFICSFASQTIKHILAVVSANYGIDKDNLFLIEMKNEFKFNPFIATNVSKHYYALTPIREGNVLKEPLLEVKGAHMRSSNIPEEVNIQTVNLMTHILNTTKEDKKIALIPILKEIADAERHIKKEIMFGSPTYCRHGKINTLTSYKNGVDSPYQYHLFWNEVFAPTYGYMDEPPYQTVVISANLTSMKVIQEWAEGIKDKALVNRLMAYLDKTNKRRIMIFHIPVIIANSKGIPEEILEAANYRFMIKNIHKTYYMLLETLGFYIDDDNALRLVSDYY